MTHQSEPGATVDVMLVASRPQDRWSLVEQLDLPPACAHGLRDGLARLAHPVSTVAAAVVLVREEDELRWVARVSRLLGDRRRVLLVALVEPPLSIARARRAGASRAVVRSGPDAVAELRALVGTGVPGGAGARPDPSRPTPV